MKYNPFLSTNRHVSFGMDIGKEFSSDAHKKGFGRKNNCRCERQERDSLQILKARNNLKMVWVGRDHRVPTPLP